MIYIYIYITNLSISRTTFSTPTHPLQPGLLDSASSRSAQVPPGFCRAKIFCKTAAQKTHSLESSTGGSCRKYEVVTIQGNTICIVLMGQQRVEHQNRIVNGWCSQFFCDNYWPYQLVYAACVHATLVHALEMHASLKSLLLQGLYHV